MSFDLLALQSAISDAVNGWIVLVPDGDVKSSTGDFSLDEAGANAALKQFAARGVELPVDWEHQTLGGEFSSPDGRAPAAGWIKTLRYTAGKGLEGQVEWNERGKADVGGRQYRYLSPVTIVRKSDRKVVGLHSVALTNTPAIVGMTALAASQKLGQWFDDKELIAMAIPPGSGTTNPAPSPPGGGGAGGATGPSEEELLKMFEALRNKLNLPATATCSDVVSAVEAIPAKEVVSIARKALNLAPDADVKTVLTALEANAAHVGYVPAEQHKAVLDRVAALEQGNVQRAAAEQVKAYLTAGKLNVNDPDQMAWANKAAVENPEGFKAIMGNAPVVIPQGKTTAPPGGSGSRAMLVAAAKVEYDESTMRVGSLRANINQALKDAGATPLTKDEATALEPAVA